MATSKKKTSKKKASKKKAPAQRGGITGGITGITGNVALPAAQNYAPKDSDG
jgi:hypothetical protein